MNISRTTTEKDIKDTLLEQASEAMQLVLSSHGVTLTSLPPQDAWLARDVSGKLIAAINAIAAMNGE